MAGHTFTLAEIFAMLDVCAPEHERRHSNHSQIVSYRGSTFALPKGAGANEPPRRVQIKAFVVRQMLRALEIDPSCTAKHLPGYNKG